MEPSSRESLALHHNRIAPPAQRGVYEKNAAGIPGPESK
jgi:hypothetical protein